MNNPKRAFSLIELLLALSIFAVIALCVYGTFWAGIKLSGWSEAENKAYHQMRLALDLMAADLENALPYDFTNSYPEKTAFEGSENTVTFLTAAPEGLKVIRYSLASPDDGRIHRVVVGTTRTRNAAVVADYREERNRASYLVREEWDFPDHVSGPAAADSEIETIAVDIAENSLKFAFGYRTEGKDTADDRYEWRPSWMSSGIPFLVRVHMDFLVTGRQERIISIDKDVVIPHGSWEEPGNT